jgi:hypothetical protein
VRCRTLPRASMIADTPEFAARAVQTRVSAERSAVIARN